LGGINVAAKAIAAMLAEYFNIRRRVIRDEGRAEKSNGLERDGLVIKKFIFLTAARRDFQIQSQFTISNFSEI
jgi:hypothetical protein